MNSSEHFKIKSQNDLLVVARSTWSIFRPHVLRNLQALPDRRTSHVALHKIAGARCAKERRTKIAEGAQSAAGGDVTEASLYVTRSVSHTRMNTNLSRLRSP